VIVLIQLIPCIVLAPFLGAFVDRGRPSSVLRVGYGLQTASLAAIAAAIGLLINAGESVKTVQARLGHASAIETVDT